MQIIGIRAGSTWRVPADWYVAKPRYTPGVDPTCGGPVAVVHDNTDTHAEGYLVDHDPGSPTYRAVIQATTDDHHNHLRRTVGALAGALGHLARDAAIGAIAGGANAAIGAITEGDSE